MDKQEIETALEECNSVLGASNCPFTQWEQEFLEDLTLQYSNGFISIRQEKMLQRLWDKI